VITQLQLINIIIIIIISRNVWQNGIFTLVLQVSETRATIQVNYLLSRFLTITPELWEGG
jgi:hypothetical protein